MFSLNNLVVFWIYFMLAATSLWQAGILFYLWRQAAGQTRRLMFGLMCYGASWMLDDIFWIFASGAYHNYPAPIVARWLLEHDAWIVTKSLILSSSIFVIAFWYMLHRRKA